MTDWHNYIKNDNELASEFSELWGSDTFPKKNRLVALLKTSGRTARLKWLSRQLYARRVALFSKNEWNYDQFKTNASLENARFCKSTENLFPGIKTDVLKRIQDGLLFNCGTRGNLEIRLFKYFKRRSCGFTYMDKNYYEEIEDLESGLQLFDNSRVSANWRDVSTTFFNYFLSPHIAIFGFEKLLRGVMRRFSNVLKVDGGKLCTKNGSAWVVDHDCRHIFRGLRDQMCEMKIELLEMIKEYLEFTRSEVPHESRSCFNEWFKQIFYGKKKDEFINMFEAVWLFEEMDLNGELEGIAMTRKIMSDILSRDGSLVSQGKVQKRVSSSNEKSFISAKKGEYAVRTLCHCLHMKDARKVALFFAKEWRIAERNGVIRKNNVEIRRFD